MAPYFEEDSPSLNLLNREVARLLFSYLFRYRKFLVYAIICLTFITGTRLLVPFLSGHVVDRFLVKKGFLVRTNGTGSSPDAGSALRGQYKHGITLDDSSCFLFQKQLSRFSKNEIERLKRDAALSPEKWSLIESPRFSIGSERKVQACIKTGDVRAYRNNQFLFSEAAIEKFSTREKMELRCKDWSGMIAFVVLISSLFLLQFAASYLQVIALMKLSQSAMRDLRQDLYRHLLSLKVSFFDKNPVGRLVNRVTNDIETLNEMFSSVLVALFQDSIIMIAIVVVMFYTNARLSWIICAAFPFLAIITIVFRAKARNAYRLIRTKISQLNSFLNENISGIRIIQVFCGEKKQFERFRAINHAVYGATIKQLMVYAVFRPSIDFFRWAAVAGVIFFGAQMLVHATISYGLIVMFLAYVANLFEPLGDIAEKFDIMQSANAAGEKILAVFKADAAHEIDMPDTIRSFPARHGHTAPIRLNGEIRFDNVWCAYAPEQWVLRGVSFSIPARSTLAIVGATGSGKSTIINLLSRLYPFQRGRITIDGIDLDEIPFSLLRSSMATVFQEMFLFSRSLRENITLGAPFDERRWDQIMTITHADRLVRRLPAGAGEMVMERGVTFSAGERQLCAFARALYADPAILVLDEATATIDSETESLIQDAIRGLVRDRTAIIIAHRLSTVRNADQIIVLNNGVIAEQGDHAALISCKGLYHDLYNMQFEPE